MMEFLRFTFQDFWHFAGVLVIIGVIGFWVAAAFTGLGEGLGRKR